MKGRRHSIKIKNRKRRNKTRRVQRGGFKSTVLSQMMKLIDEEKKSNSLLIFMIGIGTNPISTIRNILPKLLLFNGIEKYYVIGIDEALKPAALEPIWDHFLTYFCDEHNVTDNLDNYPTKLRTVLSVKQKPLFIDTMTSFDTIFNSPKIAIGLINENMPFNASNSIEYFLHTREMRNLSFLDGFDQTATALETLRTPIAYDRLRVDPCTLEEDYPFSPYKKIMEDFIVRNSNIIVQNDAWFNTGSVYGRYIENGRFEYFCNLLVFFKSFSKQDHIFLIWAEQAHIISGGQIIPKYFPIANLVDNFSIKPEDYLFCRSNWQTDFARCDMEPGVYNLEDMKTMITTVPMSHYTYRLGLRPNLRWFNKVYKNLYFNEDEETIDLIVDPDYSTMYDCLVNLKVNDTIYLQRFNDKGVVDGQEKDINYSVIYSNRDTLKTEHGDLLYSIESAVGHISMIYIKIKRIAGAAAGGAAAVAVAVAAEKRGAEGAEGAEGGEEKGGAAAEVIRHGGAGKPSV